MKDITLRSYVKVLQDLIELGHGDKPLIYRAGPEEESLYWVTDLPEPCVLEDQEIVHREGVAEEEYNVILVN